MACPLPDYLHDEIFRTMNLAFRDLPFYEKVIEPKIMKVIRDAENVEMDHKVHKRLTERYYDVAEFNKTEQGKLILTQIHIAVRTCYVLILSQRPDKRPLLWNEVQQLLFEYPQFKGLDDEELQYLLQFRNMMCLALLIVPPRMNKKLLINICARLERSGREYITGGGQKPCVTRRVLVYEREGNVQAEKREERVRKSNNSPTDQNEEGSVCGRKRQQLNPSMKKLKMIRLASDEAKQFVRRTVLPSTALLTLSRECSKHLLQEDPLYHTFTEGSEMSFDSEFSTESVLDDLFQFQPSTSAADTTSFPPSSTSYLVPAHQPCSGTLKIPALPSLPPQVPRDMFSNESSSTSACARLVHDISAQFSPGLISRQQSELLASLLLHGDMSLLHQWDTAGEDFYSDFAMLHSHLSNIAEMVEDDNNVSMHAASAIREDCHFPVAVVLPMLRAVSWDASEGGFNEELARLLASF